MICSGMATNDTFTALGGSIAPGKFVVLIAMATSPEVGGSGAGVQT